MTAVRQAEFARMLGMSRCQITTYKHQGRLVLDENGLVLVEESRKRLEETRDPRRQDVVDRHAREKAAKAAARAQAEQLQDKASEIDVSLIEVRKRREMAKAEIAEMERDKMRGLLADVAEVRRLMSEAGTLVRQSLESVPDRLAPELAGMTDQAAIHARLAEEMEAVLVALVGKLEKL